MTIGDRLEWLSSSIKQKQKRETHRKVKTCITSVIFCLISLSLIILAMRIDDHKLETYRNDAYSAMEHGDIQRALQMCLRPGMATYKDIPALYEKLSLGNSFQSILQFGEVLEGSPDIFAFFDNPIRDPELELGVRSNIAFLNRYGDQVFFRDNDDRRVHVFNGSSSSLFDGVTQEVGEILIDGDSLFFVDLEDGSALKEFSLLRGTVASYSMIRCSTFIIIGNTIFAFDKETREVTSFSKSFGKRIASVKGVDSFYFCDGLYVQSGDEIYNISLDLKRKRKIEPLSGCRLVGSNGRSLYYCDDDSVYQLETETMESRKICNNDGLLRSIYEVEGNVYIVMGIMSEKYSEEVRTVSVGEQKNESFKMA